MSLKTSKPVEKNYSQIALEYCQDILSEKILSCRNIKLACKRHLDDLEKSKSSDYLYRYDSQLANRRCSFSEKMVHVKGKWAGKKLKLEPHQVFFECAIWGWVKKKNNKRRFSLALLLIPRKNGKSIVGAISGLYGLVADDEMGSEVYSGANTEKQALEVFRPAWMMAKNNPAFCERFKMSLSGTPKNPTSIYRLSDMSRFELVVGVPGDGASPHYAIVDEFHESKNSSQFDTFSTGMGAREQPLLLVVTTAGTDTSVPCYDLYLRACKILDGTIQDDSFFALMYGIDDEDKIDDFRTWEKANPNYMVSIEEDYLKRKFTETLTDVSKQNINLTKHLNRWVNAGQAWMNMTKWAACSNPSLKLSDFKGQPCYAALDLASKIDICALVLLFEGKERTITRLLIDPETKEEVEREIIQKDFIVFGKYYLPEETIQLAGNDHYIKWVKEGYITETPGARTDFLYIENDLKGINIDHPIIELAFDPREANYLISNVSEWLGSHTVDGDEVSRCVEITQGPQLMSEPMKETEGRIYSQTLWFDGDPVMTWMMGNTVRKQGRNSGPVKYYYPTKEKNEFKIDAVVALIMAVSRAMKAVETGSVYDGLSKEDMRKKLRGEL
jgi:phage terminase large subunit-like protein